MALSTASLAFLLSGCERSLIYYPARASEDHLAARARAQGLVPWRNGAGERIGWRTATASDRRGPAMIVFHGNAGSAIDRSYYVEGFRSAGASARWEVLLFEYPGYGSRAGSPSEEAFRQAAASALADLVAEGTGPIYLTGESLGSGVACRLAADHSKNVAGLLLVTPFTSLRDVAREHYPGFLVRLLLREGYDNEAALAGYRGRVAVLLAAADEVVPAHLGERLFAGYRGPKERWVQPGRTHNTLALEPGARWWSEVVAFLHSTGPTGGSS